MPQPLRPSALLILLSSVLSIAALGCSGSVATLSPQTEQAAPPPAASPSRPPALPAAASPNRYPQAIDRAASAVNISRSAQSQDDWRLVASRWQQAIDLLKSVPANNPNRAQATVKMAEYRRNLAFAQQQANRSTDRRNPDGVVVLSLPQQSQQSQPLPQQPQSIAASAPNRVAPASSDRRGVFNAPIVRRAGGTPVVAVTFNGNQQFQMIVDTGASGTLITPQMAAALQVVPIGQASVATASARSVAFPLGYVGSIEVGGAIAQNVLVAVSGNELDIGLLGHDFFGRYDVTIRQNVVEFRER